MFFFLNKAAAGQSEELVCLCVHTLDVREDLLAVVVILVQPVHDLGRRDQVDGTEGLSHRELRDRRKNFSMKSNDLKVINGLLVRTSDRSRWYSSFMSP